MDKQFVFFYNTSFIFRHKKNPLTIAIYKGDEKRVKNLISKGEDINKQNTDGLSPLEVAASFEEFEIFKILLQSGATVPPVPKQLNLKLFRRKTVFDHFLGSSLKKEKVCPQKRKERIKSFALFLSYGKYKKSDLKCILSLYQKYSGIDQEFLDLLQFPKIQNLQLNCIFWLEKNSKRFTKEQVNRNLNKDVRARLDTTSLRHVKNRA